MSWVTLDRICQEKADAEEDFRRELERNGRPLRSSAAPLSDDELLAKLRELGLDVDRDGVERLCEGALSAQEVAKPIGDKLKLANDMKGDWIWISLVALWQRWWPERVCMELLDDKMQAGYVQDSENDTHAAVVTWLDAWSDVLRLCDATGIGSIEEFDERFPLTQSMFNWSQDLEIALDNAGRDDGEIRRALIDFCEESFRRFPREDQLLTENRRRTMAESSSVWSIPRCNRSAIILTASCSLASRSPVAVHPGRRPRPQPRPQTAQLRLTAHRWPRRFSTACSK
jgi:hypothetical protein